MQNGKPYILFCAGEDSGDCLGEDLVRQVLRIGSSQERSVDVVGSGGVRMQNAGLVPLVCFDDLPVSGFGDVLPRYLKLRKSYKALERVLYSDRCLALVAIDYPGFNMKLVALAKKLGKPVLYVAPPQIWAWKSHRARLFAGCSNILLATFFDFEVDAYQKADCGVVKTIHPFAKIASSRQTVAKSKRVLLLPGSRKSQALRNVPVFLGILKQYEKKCQFKHENIVLLAARKSLVSVLEKSIADFCTSSEWNVQVSVELSPASAEERFDLFCGSSVAISAPGTATLELALSGCPTVVCTKPDFLTMTLAKRSVKTKYFALPNIILQKEILPEFISRKFDSVKLDEIADAAIKKENEQNSFSDELLQNLQTECDSEKLVSEFLAQFV